ncbi:YeeE/YedE family protein [Campylobacter sp. 19-13652]|uniref:YeeE/YedE family protein n=1 Tax=Campylobacter sp. 19-13652 TaxID=2840180 RepID=UPI001C79295C|nr:YeeE/YedE family protein [Campylobacter sp. 19-13652]BCX78794.1 membrane protein [Campylobacter sp. 19-13652]
MPTSFIIGLSLGFVFQRSQFCFYSGFSALFRGEFKFITALLAAIFIQSIAIFTLADFRLLAVPSSDFSALSVVLGAAIFGFGMALAKTCASGAFFRIGEGSLAALITAIFFILGVIASTSGLIFSLLKPLFKHAQISGNLSDILGVSPWVLVGVLGISLAFSLWLTRVEFERARWDKFKLSHLRYYALPLLAGGVVVGVLAVWAWLDSFSVGRYFGFSFSLPSANLLEFVLTAQHRYLNWGSLFVLGVPIGAFISARLSGEFCLHAGESGELWQRIVGGLAMGVGAGLAGGCNVANALIAPAYFGTAAIMATPITIIAFYFSKRIFKI